MESAFARIYRSSKLASYDRGIEQIYTSYGKAAKQKDWGLKRPMAKFANTKLAFIRDIDAMEQVTDFAPANKEYIRMKTWTENFTESHSPHYSSASEHTFDLLDDFDTLEPKGKPKQGASETKRRHGPLRNIGKMTRRQWAKFLEEAHARRAEWKGELAKGNFAPEEALTFMGATNVSGIQNDGIHRQPTYHDYAPPTETLQVQGRVLGRVAAMYTVAVQGIIATLPLQNHAMEAGFHYRDVKNFYVHSARFDDRGRPQVVLGLQPRGSRESSVSFNANRGSFEFSKSEARSSMRAKYMDQIKNSMILGQLISKRKEGKSGKSEQAPAGAKPDDNKGGQ
ncbi:hypothetical protein IWW40_004483 [Coemansia sp. RSA 1250]|nr:hypothetical protein IWW40_004483 [Coemansia sp. RSA 1250]